MKELSKKNQRKRDPVKAKAIRNIFEIDDIPSENVQKTNKIKIDYNKTIYFNKGNSQMKEDMSKYLSNAFSSNHKESEEAKTQTNMLRTMKVNHHPLVLMNQPKMRTSDNDLDKKNRTEDIPWDLNINDSDTHFGYMKNPSMASTTSTIFPQGANKMRSSNSRKHLESHAEYDNLLFVPCMNCGNNISVNDIEQHSLKCTQVSEEVLKNETNAYELYPINYKLKRLKEHAANISNGKVEVPKEFEKEIKYIATVLLQYITDTLDLEIISLSSLKEFKKILKNLETLSLTYKTSISSLILIDRTKVLVNEKHKIFRETLRIQVNTRKSNSSKTGFLEYENKIKEEIKKIQQIELETELEKTKVKNLRKSATPKNALKNSGNSFNMNAMTNEDEFNEDILLNDQIYTNGQMNNNQIDDIVSDIGNHSQVMSDNTSMSIMLSDATGEENLLGNSYLNNITNPNIDDSKGDVQLKDLAKEKRDFFKEVLKIKFEKLHSTHKGLQTPQKLIWEECKRMQISRKKWKEFIFGELNSPIKYINLAKNKSKFGVNSMKPTMSIIDEEKL